MAAVDDVLDEVEEDYGKRPTPKAVNVVDDLLDHFVVIDDSREEIINNQAKMDEVIGVIIKSPMKKVTLNSADKRQLRYEMLVSMLNPKEKYYGLIGARDLEDDMVDQIERKFGYSKEVTDEMKRITDSLLDATVEARSPDTTIDEDESSGEEAERNRQEYEEGEEDIEVITTIPRILKFPKQKIVVDERIQEGMRYALLQSMATGGDYARLLEPDNAVNQALKGLAAQRAVESADFYRKQEKASKALGLGGTKRRKSKKTKKAKKRKGTKRKLK